MEFDAVLRGDMGGEGSGGAGVRLDFDVPAVFGGGKRAAVRGTVNGVPFRGRVSVYGGEYWVGFRKEIREAARMAVGDTVHLVMEADTEPREVTVPDDLAKALKGAPDASGRFEGLSFTHRKEYVVWVTGAKRPQTRERRVAKTIEMLREGVRHP